jgi:hypothetical protein
MLDGPPSQSFWVKIGIRYLEDQIAEYALGGGPCLSGPEISESSKAPYDKRVRVFGKDVL